MRAHEPNFERLAESWASDRPTHPGTFCNFKPDNYRWGGVFIRKVSNRYEVDRGGKKTDFATLEEAQRDAGADPTAFSFWSQLTEQNHVYCVEYGADETVEIMLAGSDWSPYGFRYAPKGDPHAYEALVSNARQGQTYNTDRYMEHVSGRWFYFDGKR